MKNAPFDAKNRREKQKGRLRRFLRNALAPELALLESFLAALFRLRAGWIVILLLSLGLHSALLPLVMLRPPARPPSRPKHVALHLRFLRKAKRPVAPKVKPQTEVQRPAVTPPVKAKKPLRFPPPAGTIKQASGSPKKAKPGKRPLGVFGLGSGPRSGGGGGTGGTGGSKGALLRRYGGSDQTEKAVMDGLAWLAEHQAEDGRWDCDGFEALCPAEDRCGGAGNPQYDVGVTALALAAFLAQGREARKKWPGVVEKALRFLSEEQRSNGAFGVEEASFMYNQATATYAMAYAAAQFPTRPVKRAVQKALAFIAAAQQAAGGWDYTSEKTGRNDLSISGWQILAIHAAKKRGFSYPEDSLMRAASLVRRMVLPDKRSVIYADSRLGARELRPGLIPVALLGLLLTGQSTRDPLVRLLADETLGRLPNAAQRVEWKRTGQSLYYWYYGTLALFELGSPWWPKWNRAMQAELLPLQRKEGHAKGSWDPDRNWIGKVGGRVCATSLAVLTLEIYYRVVPLQNNGSQTGDSSL